MDPIRISNAAFGQQPQASSLSGTRPDAEAFDALLRSQIGDESGIGSAELIPLGGGERVGGSHPLTNSALGSRSGAATGSVAPEAKFYSLDDQQKPTGVEAHRLEMEMRAAFLREMLAPLVDALSSGLTGQGSMAGQDVYEYFVGQAMSQPLASAWPLPAMVDPGALSQSPAGASVPGIGGPTAGRDPRLAASLLARNPAASALPAASASQHTPVTRTVNVTSTVPAGKDAASFDPASSRRVASQPMDLTHRSHGGSSVDELVSSVAREFALPESLLHAVVQVESSGNPRAVSPKGARGLMQLMPATARELGVTDSFDPEQNLRGGAAYLAKQIERFGDLPRALAAYNAGPGAVQKHGGVPPYRETQHYVSRVMGLAEQLER